MSEHEQWHIVISGNPFTGFKHYGPFAFRDTAEKFGEKHFPNVEFWVTPLTYAPPPAGPVLAVDNSVATNPPTPRKP